MTRGGMAPVSIRLRILGMVLLGTAVLSGCVPQPPSHDCPIETLVLDERAFPAGSSAARLLSPLPRAAWASAGRTIDLPVGIANHDVYQFKTAQRAAQEYSRRRVLQFPSDEGPWATPYEITYRSPIADQYCVQCSMARSYGPMCKMLAQYEEYYVYVTAHMSEGSMTYADFQNVLRAIDERMSACLQKPLPPSPSPAPAG